MANVKYDWLLRRLRLEDEGAGAGPGAGVDSFNGRTGVVSPLSGDYPDTLIPNSSTVAGANVKEALDSLGALLHTHPNKAELDLLTDGDHDVRSDNPHGVTAAQAGASPTGHGHVAADVSDFDTEVANETSVAANTAARHSHANKTELDLVSDGDHDVRSDNPHGVTAAQAGASPTGHTHLEADITDLSHTDPDAIHDNVAGEIAAVALKAVTVAADILLIEDSAAANAKKRTTVGGLRITESQITDLTHGDSDAIHDNVDGEINAIASKASPVGADVVVIEDSAASFAKKKVLISNLPGGTDADAIHDNVAGEIAAITSKSPLVAADIILIEDSAAANAKKSATIADIRITESQITDLTHTDSDAIHDNVASEISAVTEKAAPIDADLILIEDSAAANVKKRVEIGKINASRWHTHNTPANIAANQNDYDPGNARWYRLNPTTSTRDITGFAPTGGNSLNGHGRRITIVNISTSIDLKLMHQNVGSTAANRILASGGSDFTVSANESAELQYDPTTARWRII